MSGLWRFLDLLIPRFMREDVALVLLGGEYHIAFPLSCVAPGERFDGIATMEVFNLFGHALFPRQVGEVRPFVNPHDPQEAI